MNTIATVLVYLKHADVRRMMGMFKSAAILLFGIRSRFIRVEMDIVTLRVMRENSVGATISSDQS